MEADVKPDTKTHKRMEDAAADRVKHGDSSSAKKRVDAGPTSLTSFGMIAEPPALPCWDGALVDKNAEAPKPCLLPVEMRTPPGAAGLLPTGTASTAMRTIFSRPLPSWTLGEETQGRTSPTGRNQLASPCWRRIIQTESRKTMMLDPGGSTGRIHACQFLGGWRALLCGEVYFGLDATMVSEAGAVLVDGELEYHFPERRLSDSLRRTYCG